MNKLTLLPITQCSRINLCHRAEGKVFARNVRGKYIERKVHAVGDNKGDNRKNYTIRGIGYTLGATLFIPVWIFLRDIGSA
jgi:hypothetical protein